MRENLDMFDGLITKCAWLKDTTELVQVLAAAIHSPLFEEESGFRAALALHFSLQRQAEELPTWRLYSAGTAPSLFRTSARYPGACGLLC